MPAFLSLPSFFASSITDRALFCASRTIPCASFFAFAESSLSLLSIELAFFAAKLWRTT